MTGPLLGSVSGDVSDILRALSALAWPVLAALVLWRIGPGIGRALADAIRGRDVTAKAGPVEVTVGGKSVPLDQAVVNNTKVISDLLTRPPSSARTSPGDDRETYTPLVRTVLWVDDEHDGIALEVAALNERGVTVHPETSTEAGIAAVRRDGYDAVISDMGRTEGGRYVAEAGLELLRRVREVSPLLPFFLYTTPEKAQTMGAEALAAGAFGITASPSVLMELLLVTIGPHSAQRIAREAVATFAVHGFSPDEELEGRGVDMLVRSRDRVVGVEIRAQASRPPDDQFATTLRRAGHEARNLGATELLYVTAASIGGPPEDGDLPLPVTVLAVGELDDWLTRARAR